MRINVVNPNTTASMTAKIAAAARAAAGPDTEIIGSQPDVGPESIEGYVDEALCLPGLLERIGEGERSRVDGHVIACFNDTGLDAARSVATAPVVGIGEAAYFLAALIASRFSVVTTVSRTVRSLEHNLERYGLASRCVKVRATEVPVLTLEDPNSSARERISAEIAQAIREDGAEAIVLGCAGMSDLATAFTNEHGLPVVEGVAASVKLVEALHALRLTTSKLGAWAAPSPKPYLSRLQHISALAK